MADFIIRPSGDSDWANALYLQAPLPVTARDAAALGLTLGTNYQIGELGVLANFSVSDRPEQMAAPLLQAGNDQITATLASAPGDNGAAISQFDLRYSTDQSTWSEALDITSPHVITGLSTSTAYFVQTRAVNANGGGDWSASTSATTGLGGSADVPAPVGSDPSLTTAQGGVIDVDALSVSFRLTDDPAALTVTNRTAALVPLAEYTGNEQLAVNWTNGIFVSQQAINDEVTLTTTTPGMHVMVWEAREADHGTNPPDPRRWSSGAVPSAQVLLDNAPGTMGQPSLSQTNTTITVVFGTDPTGGVAPIIRYDVRYRLSPSGTWITDQDVSSGMVISGLTEGTAYDIQTRAANEPAGGGAWSVLTTISTQTGADTTPPSAQSTAVSAQDNDGDISLTATTLSEDAPNSFFVLTTSATAPSQAQVLAGQDDSGSAAFAAGSFAMTQAMPSDTITGLPDVDGTYHMYVVYGDAVSNYSAVISAGSVDLSFGSAAPVIEQQVTAYSDTTTTSAGGFLETSAITIGSGESRMLIAAVAAGTPGANDDLTNATATFGASGRSQGTGSVMTPLMAGSGDRRTHVLFFALPAPASGAGTVQITANNDNTTCAAVRLYELSGANQTVGSIVEAGSVVIDQTALSAQLTTTSDSMLAISALGLEPQGSADISPELSVSGSHVETDKGFTGTPSQNSDICFAFASGVVPSTGADTAGWVWTTAADCAIARIAIGGA